MNIQVVCSYRYDMVVDKTIGSTQNHNDDQKSTCVQRNATQLFFSDTQEITNADANLVAYLVDAGTHSDRGWWWNKRR